MINSARCHPRTRRLDALHGGLGKLSRSRLLAPIIRSSSIAFAAFGGAVATGQAQTALTVNSGSDLLSAINAIDGNPTTSYVITINGSVSLSGQILLPISTKGSVTFNGGGAGATLDFGGTANGFQIFTGTVAFNALTIQNALTRGGGGGTPGGGAAAGMGGAIFVANGANLTLGNVTFRGNTAAGGAGGGITSVGSEAAGNGGLPGTGGPFGNDAQRGSRRHHRQPR